MSCSTHHIQRSLANAGQPRLMRYWVAVSHLQPHRLELMSSCSVGMPTGFAMDTPHFQPRPRERLISPQVFP